MRKFSGLAKAIQMALATAAISIPSASVYAENEVVESVERITITGSKIKRIGASSPTPITVIDGAALVAAGIINAADLINKLPSSSVGMSPETSNEELFSAGLNQTSLRNLGSSRTLTLVNGRRYIGSGDGINAVDLNMIPASMIERIEIVTGGASAVYGSDAVAGVLNIITKQSYDGVEIDISTTQPREGGGEESHFSLLLGTDFDNGKGNVVFNANITKQKQLMSSERNFRNTDINKLLNPLNTSSTDGIPARIAQPIDGAKNYFFNYSGVTGTEFFEKLYTWTNDGSLKLLDYGDGIVDADKYLCTGETCDGISPKDYEMIRTPLDREVFSLNANYDINDEHSLFFESSYASSSSQGFSTGVIHAFVPINFTNGYLTEGMKDQLGLGTWLGFFGQADYLAMNRVDSEFGNRRFEEDRETSRFVIGAQGQLSDDWYYNFHFQQGKVVSDTLWTGEIIEERYLQAIDSVEDGSGNIVCRDSSNGCTPFNPFGVMQASQESIDWIGTNASRTATDKQTSTGLTVDGDLYELPAGFISAAFSAEYRKEEVKSIPDELMSTGQLSGNLVLPLIGSYNVKEASAEFSVPLLVDSDFADALNVDLAYRWMDYSSAGVHNAWKLGLNWDINSELKVRASRSKSVRAPTNGELLSQGGTTFSGITDVCSVEAIDLGTEYRRGNCESAGITAGWQPSDAWQGLDDHEGIIKGNDGLDAETSYDYTVGFSYAPSELDGVSFTVDYWNIKITNAITFVDVNTAIRACYDSTDADNLFCGNFQRDEGLDIVSYVEAPINAAVFETKGIDVELHWPIDTANYGIFSVDLLSTYLINWSSNGTGLAGDTDKATGEMKNPRWKAHMSLSWVYADFNMQFIGDYRHATVGDVTHTIEDTDFNNIPSYIKWDLLAGYAFGDNLSVRLGVKNVFDEFAPRNPYTYTNNSGLFDSLGRSLYAGLTYKF